jgi:hypothetical protein
MFKITTRAKANQANREPFVKFCGLNFEQQSESKLTTAFMKGCRNAKSWLTLKLLWMID